jgi:hypothetical protein
MLHDDWYARQFDHERRQAMLREAARQPLLRAARAGRPTRPPVHRRALAWLGQHLVVWGWRLTAVAGEPYRPRQRLEILADR